MLKNPFTLETVAGKASSSSALSKSSALGLAPAAGNVGASSESISAPNLNVGSLIFAN